MGKSPQWPKSPTPDAVSRCETVPPEEIVALTSEVFEACCSLVVQSQGAVDKFAVAQDDRSGNRVCPRMRASMGGCVRGMIPSERVVRSGCRVTKGRRNGLQRPPSVPLGTTSKCPSSPYPLPVGTALRGFGRDGALSPAPEAPH